MISDLVGSRFQMYDSLPKVYGFYAALTKNPELAAVLIEKAADLKSQVDDANPPKDVSPRAPDVEPSP